MADHFAENHKKETAGRKSFWRFVFAALAVYGALELLGGLWVNILYWFLRLESVWTPNEAVSVGIIGGADGPTAVFLTAPVWVHYIVPVVVLVLGIWGFLHFNRIKKK